MFHSKIILITLVFSTIFISGCTNMGADLKTGKEARRAGNYTLAIEHLSPLAEFGIDEAKYELALAMTRPKDASFEDYQKARALLIEVQGKRKAPALFEIARMHKRGLGIKKNTSKAKNLYRTSGEMGYQRANYELADILIDEKKYTKAKDLCVLAFNNKYKRASMCIARLYEKGYGSSQNLKKALAWYMVAERNNVKRSSNKVKELSSRLSSTSISDATTLSMGLE